MDLLNQKVNNILKSIITKHGFKSYELIISPGAKEGDNFIGDVYKISIKDNENKLLKVFLKIPKEDAELRKNIGVSYLFQTEIFMLTKVIPGYKRLDQEKGLQGGFSAFPEALATSSTEFEEYIVMKDLCEEGFKMFDSKHLNDMQLVLIELGKFHAAGFAMKDQKPFEYQQYHKYIELISKKNIHGLTDLDKHLIKVANDNLKFEEKYVTIWENFQQNFFCYLADCRNGEKAEPYAVLLHGDLRNNNLMLKYMNGQADNVCFVDWQFSRHCSPVLDLVYYIFMGSDKCFRQTHYETLLSTYYKSLANHMSALGSDPNKLFPYSVFLDHLKKFGKYAAISSIFFIVLLQSDDNINKISEIITDPSCLNNDQSIKDRFKIIHDTFTDIVNLGYL